MFLVVPPPSVADVEAGPSCCQLEHTKRNTPVPGVLSRKDGCHGAASGGKTRLEGVKRHFQWVPDTGDKGLWREAAVSLQDPCFLSHSADPTCFHLQPQPFKVGLVPVALQGLLGRQRFMEPAEVFCSGLGTCFLPFQLADLHCWVTSRHCVSQSSKLPHVVGSLP